MRACLVFLGLAACGVGDVDDVDEFWADTADDTGEDDPGLRAGGKQVAIAVGSTSNAELVDNLPIGRSENGATRRVVLHLGPSELPKLVKGDRLIVPAEVQVTTRCDIGQSAPGCGYNPNVAAQLILTGSGDDTSADGAGSKALSRVEKLTCTKNEHHCKIVFTAAAATNVLDGGFALPCLATDSCHVNLVMWSWHADARSGGADKLLVGSNEGNYLDNGKIERDAARIMAIRERGIVGADRASRQTDGGGGLGVPTNANSTLVYSHLLKPGGRDLEAGEQFYVEAKLVTDVADRARFSTLMFLTKDPKATEDNGLVKIAPGAITEHNGINCTRETSPCVTRRVAVFRVQEEITGPVYVNVIARSAVPGGGSTKVTVKRNDGWLRSVRYAADLAR